MNAISQCSCVYELKLPLLWLWNGFRSRIPKGADLRNGGLLNSAGTVERRRCLRASDVKLNMTRLT